MRQSGFIVPTFALICFARAADATSPIDYAQRNAPFAPGATTAPAPKKDTPQINDRVQQKRVEKPAVEKETSPLADRRAPITVEETREKFVREKNSRRPEASEQPTSAFDHKPAAISTSADTRKPPTVAKYQDGLAAATPWGPAAAKGNKATFAATDSATTAKINRFVFRKNPVDPAAPTQGAAVIPAAGGAAIQK